MRDRMAEAIESLGGEAEVEVVMDDSWSTDRITPEGREKLRAAGFAPPAPREAAAPQLVPVPGAGRGGAAEARAAPGRVVPLPVLRLDRDEAGEHLRPDPVPLDPLLHRLPPAVRAGQDNLVDRASKRARPEHGCGSSATLRGSAARKEVCQMTVISALFLGVA